MPLTGAACCLKVEGYRAPALNILLCESCYSLVLPPTLQFPLLFFHFISLGPRHINLYCSLCLHSLVTQRTLNQCLYCTYKLLMLAAPYTINPS